MRLAMMTAATVYIVSPDRPRSRGVPHVFGLADDAIMVAWFAGAVLAETDRFLAWEARQGVVIPGAVTG